MSGFISRIPTKVTTYVGAIVRSRKVHLLLASLALFLAVTHTLKRQGIRIDYLPAKPHSSEATYASIPQIMDLRKVVTDIYIQKCARGFECAPPISTSLASWEKIPTKLNLFSDGILGWNYYMYVEKSVIAEAERFVIDILFTLTDEQPKPTFENSKFIRHVVSSSGFMWIEYLDSNDEKVRTVRDINVFFGKDDMTDARRHWKFQRSGIPLPGDFLIRPKISMLKIAVADEMEIFRHEVGFDGFFKKNEILLSMNSKFKILQISDLHIGQDEGICFDDCKFDADTLDFVQSAIRNEGDILLVVITGDMIDFKHAKHHESVVLKALAPVLLAEIPFVFVFGDTDYDPLNHLSKVNMLKFISSLPGCYNKQVQYLDHRVHGLSNGNVRIYRVNGTIDEGLYNVHDLVSQKADALITYLDSEDKMVADSQANYVYRVNHKPFADTEQKLMFLHNPLPNFRPEGTVKLIGSYNEKHPLVTETDKKFLEDIKTSGYKVVAVGHEHENDACIWEESDDKKILLCYSGVTGEAGITRLDPFYKRRLRIFELDFEKNRILSWKRDQEKSLDPQEIWSAEAAGQDA